MYYCLAFVDWLSAWCSFFFVRTKKSKRKRKSPAVPRSLLRRFATLKKLNALPLERNFFFTFRSPSPFNGRSLMPEITQYLPTARFSPCYLYLLFLFFFQLALLFFPFLFCLFFIIPFISLFSFLVILLNLISIIRDNIKCGERLLGNESLRVELFSRINLPVTSLVEMLLYTCLICFCLNGYSLFLNVKIIYSVWGK